MTYFTLQRKSDVIFYELPIFLLFYSLNYLYFPSTLLPFFLMLTHILVFLISFPPKLGLQIILSIVSKISSYPWISFLNHCPQQLPALSSSLTNFLFFSYLKHSKIHKSTQLFPILHLLVLPQNIFSLALL